MLIWNQENSRFQSRVGLCPDFHIRGSAARQYGDNMLMQTTEEEILRFDQNYGNSCTALYMLNTCTMGQQGLKIMDSKRFLPSGRATCAPTLPEMVKTRRKTKKVLWGFFGPIEALCGSREGPTGVFFRSSSSHFTALDHRCRRALIEVVITKSLTDGDHNWKLSLNSIRRNLHTCASTALLKVIQSISWQGSPPCAPKSDWALSERLN